MLKKRKSKSYCKQEILPVKSELCYGRVYVKASVNGNEEMALLDTEATLSVISESMAAYSIDPKHIQAPDLETTSATNHKLEAKASRQVTGKAKASVQVGDNVIVPVTLYIAKNFFRHLLFGIDFMNESRASLSFPANTLTIDGKSIPTKIRKIKPGMHSICDLTSSAPYVMPQRAARTVPFDIPLKEEGIRNSKMANWSASYLYGISMVRRTTSRCRIASQKYTTATSWYL